MRDDANMSNHYAFSTSQNKSMSDRVSNTVFLYFAKNLRIYCCSTSRFFTHIIDSHLTLTHSFTRSLACSLACSRSLSLSCGRIPGRRTAPAKACATNAGGARRETQRGERDKGMRVCRCGSNDGRQYFHYHHP